MYFIPIVIFAIIIFIIIASNNHDFSGTTIESPARRAGIKGEQAAENIIRGVLREDDFLFTNTEVSYDDKRTELDNIIVNKYGVFIIEVKNYNGRLAGTEDDYEWTKYHTTDAGNIYSKAVKNPIKQVKRQIFILAKYLEYYGTKVWVTGYAFLLHGNCPFESEYVLSSIDDIDKAIHTRGRVMLTKQTIDSIIRILQ